MTNPDRLILVVEDDDDVRQSVGNALEDEGYRVDSAANGLEALNRLRHRGLRPDLILLDLTMPVMDGWAFRVEQLKDADLAAIPVIVFTAHGIPREVAQQLNAAGFIAKPVRLEALLSAVERIPQSEP